MAILDVKKIFSGGGRKEKPGRKLTPPPKAKGPFEKRGGIPRADFKRFFKKGPYSLPWSKGRSQEQLKKMGKGILEKRFRGYYGSDISGSEIQREILKLRRTVPKTGAERAALQEQIARLEEVKKRAGL